MTENEIEDSDLGDSYDPTLDDEDCESVDIVESSNEEDLKSLVNNCKGEFRCETVTPVDAIDCYVSNKLFNEIQEIERLVKDKFGSNQEFSIYLHADFDDDGDLIVSDTFYIPKQKVSTASVDYQEEPHSFYNGCLHRHPDGCTSFSGVDKTYINSNFEFSLLYVQGKISMGIVNIKYHNNRRYQAKLRIIVQKPVLDEEINIDNITRPVATPKIYNPSKGTIMPQVVQPNLLEDVDNVPEIENESTEDDDAFFRYLTRT